MPDWLRRLLDSYTPALLDLLSNLWWALSLLFAGLAWAVSRVWKRCDKRHVESWCSDLVHSDEKKRQEGQERLIACGARSVSTLAHVLRKTDSDNHRKQIVAVLCEIGPPALEPLLAARKEDRIAPFVDDALEKQLPDIVKGRALEQAHTSPLRQLWKRLTGTTSESIVECLIRLLDNPDPIVQEGAAIALGQYRDPDVVQALGKRLYPTECKQAEVRKAVAESLGQMKMPYAIPYLKIGLRDPIWQVRMAVCQALAQIRSTDDVLALEAVLLPFEEVSVRIEAAKALGAIGGDIARKVLEEALGNIPDDDDHRELRTVVGDQLAKLQRVPGK